MKNVAEVEIVQATIVQATVDRWADVRAELDGSVDAARRAGVPGVEAYLIDPAGRRVEAGFALVGIASMFDAAGFRRVQVTDARSAGLPPLLVRLDLGGVAT